jgi:hypothetical protein
VPAQNVLEDLNWAALKLDWCLGATREDEQRERCAPVAAYVYDKRTEGHGDVVATFGGFHASYDLRWKAHDPDRLRTAQAALALEQRTGKFRRPVGVGRG